MRSEPLLIWLVNLLAFHDVKSVWMTLGYCFFRFERVPLITPNGDVLVSELNFEASLYKLHVTLDARK